MKKYITIIMVSLILLTGCGKKEEDNKIIEDTKKTTLKAKSKTTTKKTTTKTAKKSTTKKKTTRKSRANTTHVQTTTQATTVTTTTTVAPTTTTTKTTTTKKLTTTRATTTKSSLSESSVYNAMISLKSKYPNQMKWDNSNHYDWKGGIFSRGYGCAGFAFMLSDAAFGSRAARKVNDFNNIRVGDIIRMNADTHSVIVLSVSGSSYTVAEANVQFLPDTTGRVYWGRTIDKSEVQSNGTYVLTRW